MGRALLGRDVAFFWFLAMLWAARRALFFLIKKEPVVLTEMVDSGQIEERPCGESMLTGGMSPELRDMWRYGCPNNVGWNSDVDS